MRFIGTEYVNQWCEPHGMQAQRIEGLRALENCGPYHKEMQSLEEMQTIP